MSNCFKLNDGTDEGILDGTDDGDVGTSFGAELGGVEIAAMGDLLGFIDNEGLSDGPPEGCADTLGMIDGDAEGLTDNEGMFDGAPDGIADELGM